MGVLAYPDLIEALEEHHRSCFGWALSCCAGDASEAEEVLQSTYLKVLDGRAQFNGRSGFKTWLFAIIRATAGEGRRRVRRRVRLLQSMFQSASAEGQPSTALDEVRRRELREEMNKVLAHLSGRQREVLQLVFYHDLTLDEAAEVMGISVGSARVHYDRGKNRLRGYLRNWETNDGH